MMRKLMTPLIMLGLAIGFSACSDNNKDPVPAGTTSLGSMYQALKETPQNFAVAAGAFQTITGARGTIITFNPQSFKDASGNIISSGTVDIKLTEAYTPGQMILNNVTTVTDMNNALGSGGCVNIEATINKHEVFANNYSISFKQQGPNEQAMALFQGKVISEPVSGTVIWSNDSTRTVPRATKDVDGTNFYYAFDTCLNFNWVNCDHFAFLPDPKSDVKVVVPDTSFNIYNTRVFVIFPDMNMITGMSHYDPATHTYNLGYSSYFLPIGTNIKVVVMVAKDNVYYFDMKENISVTNNISITVNPVAKPLSDIQTILIGL